jgi:hypothetical protein
VQADEVVHIICHHTRECLALPQRLFRPLALVNVDDDAAERRDHAPLRDHAHDVPHPDGPPVGGDHPVFVRVIALLDDGAPTRRHAPIAVRCVKVDRPEARREPSLGRMAQQSRGMPTHEREFERSRIGFPDDGSQALDELLGLLRELRVNRSG